MQCWLREQLNRKSLQMIASQISYLQACLNLQASGVRCQKFGYFAWKFIDVHLIATENMFTLAGIVPTVRSYWVFLSSVTKKYLLSVAIP